MSEKAPRLFEARFRWAILQEMKPLRDQFLDTPNPEYDGIYAQIRDIVWAAATKIVQDRSPGEAGKAVDPLSIELADVRYCARTLVSEFLGDEVVDSAEEETVPDERLATEARQGVAEPSGLPGGQLPSESGDPGGPQGGGPGATPGPG